MFIDRGQSGYHGTHRKHGRLGALIEAAKAGRFEPGTVIVVEVWDRLGRLRPDKQTELISELLRTGISIGVCRLNEIFTEEDFGTHKWTTLSVFVQLAHQESKQKAERLRSVWESRRKRVRENGEKLGGSLPGWIDRVRGEFRLIPERAAALQRIFTLAAEGYGVTKIVRALTDERVKPFRHSAWTKGYVAQLLGDRKVIGEHQPKKRVVGKDDVRRAVADGEPVSGYYPVAVTLDQWNLARASQGRKGRNGPRQRKYANVFKGMLVNVVDGMPMNMVSAAGRGGKSRLVLKSEGISGGSVTFPYYPFERAILSALREVKPEDAAPSSDRPATSADTIRAKLAAVRSDLAAVKADLAREYSRALSDVLRAKEAEEVALVNTLSDELARTAKPLSKAWDEAQSLMALIDTAEDPDAVRLRIRAALAAVVDRVRLFVLPDGNKLVRRACAQVWFRQQSETSVCREYLILARAGQPPAVASYLSGKGEYRPLDFTLPEDVKLIKSALRSLDE